MDSPLLLYDRDCGVCTATAKAIHVLDLRHRLRIQALQDSASLLPSVPSEELLGVARFVSADGRVASGGDVISALSAALLGTPELETLLQASPAVRSAMNRTYETLATLRDQLTCRVAPSS